MYVTSCIVHFPDRCSITLKLSNIFKVFGGFVVLISDVLKKSHDTMQYIFCWATLKCVLCKQDHSPLSSSLKIIYSHSFLFQDNAYFMMTVMENDTKADSCYKAVFQDGL